ncbi:LysR family transcriptional regulator [Nocardia acidivorans]|uniref:LysR family transcriptional regulator n=1 Tax=Nocardia acidivorans TaxID=404580 RepID=UPI001C3FC9D3|nr:LysR family transcriptional regulator [Nocardia acidivorans]
MRLLVELSERGTIAAVADALYITPAGVSQQLASLESEARTQLLERIGRRVRLTAAGELLVGAAKEILADIEQAEAGLEQLRGSISGLLRLSCVPTASAAAVPTVTKLRAEYPELDLKLEQRETPDALRALKLGEIDLALVDSFEPQPRSDDPVLQRIPLLDDQLVVLLGAEHRLAQSESLRIEELRAENWVLCEEGTPWCEYLGKLCEDAGFTPNVVARSRSIDFSAAYVEASDSVAVPSLLLLRDTHRRRVVSVPLEPTAYRYLGLALRKSSTTRPSMRAALDAFTRLFA